MAHNFRNPRIFLILVTLIAYYPANTLANDQDLTYMTLNGLHALTVQIDGIRRDFTRFGLDAETILQTTTDTLRESGIDVVDLDAAKTNPGAALMRIKLNANENQYRFYFYGISIELKQKIALNNPAGGFISATIWQEGKTGVVMPTELRKMNGLIADLLAEFIKDYRSQNPERVSAIR